MLSSYAAVITSTGAGGAWNVGSTWVGGVIPGAADDVTIASGATVTVPASVSCRTLTINGNLTMTGSGITLSITNNGGGVSPDLILGSGSNLFIGATNTLQFSSTQASGIQNNGGTIASTGTNGSDGGTILVNTCCGGGFTVSGTASTTVNNLQFVQNANFNISSGGLFVNGTFTVPNNNWSASGSTLSPVYGPAS
ncbi:MAG TPA: G8 domain-containing protein, partial [Cytophagaceae bacterium]|nr:G8 domain-containing protein [Cytophagaceae bacterium]